VSVGGVGREGISGATDRLVYARNGPLQQVHLSSSLQLRHLIFVI
jgi:hypothetical protein